MIGVFYFFQQPGTYPFISFLQNRLDRIQHILIAGPQLFDDLFVGLLLLVDVEMAGLTFGRGQHDVEPSVVIHVGHREAAGLDHGAVGRQENEVDAWVARLRCACDLDQVEIQLGRRQR